MPPALALYVIFFLFGKKETKINTRERKYEGHQKICSFIFFGIKRRENYKIKQFLVIIYALSNMLHLFTLYVCSVKFVT